MKFKKKINSVFKKIIISIPLFFLLLSFTSSEFQLLLSLKNSGGNFSADNLGNIYFVNDDQLSKFDSQGNLLRTYGNKSAGKITFVDVSNPMKILIYYKDFSQIIFLDNTLSITGDPILLDRLDMGQSTLACTSYNSSFWLYEPQLAQLIRFDAVLNLSEKSGNIIQSTGNEINPNFLIEENNFIYLNDPKIGILQFDRYGGYMKTIPVKDLISFQVMDNKIFYLVNHSIIKSYNLKNFEESEINLPEKNINSFWIGRNKIYLQSDEKLNVYTIK